MLCCYLSLQNINHVCCYVAPYYYKMLIMSIAMLLPIIQNVNNEHNYTMLIMNITIPLPLLITKCFITIALHITTILLLLLLSITIQLLTNLN
jgi:hypothetical protein